MINFRFANTYSQLPEQFYARVLPTPVSAPRLLHFNKKLAEDLGLDLVGTESTELAEIFAGNRIPEGAEPLAMAYAGHQFGQFVPRLGDGRAILLGEVVDRRGVRRDLHLKGAGPTPFSRGGDGRAALGPVIRELIVSEAMHALGVPTTRTLATVATGETVRRERRYPGAVLARIAESHLRIGTFEYFAAQGDQASVRRLANYAIARHYPHLRDEERLYLRFFEAVMEAQAQLIASWMSIGFIHGVMNTDNMTISGETIDYGPCAFMDAYEPMKVYSAIDRGGRYAFGRQPQIAQWNLARLAETLLALFDEEPLKAVAMAEEKLESFTNRFEEIWLEKMSRKLGLSIAKKEDKGLIQDFLALMETGRTDFTNSFRALIPALTEGAPVLLPGGQSFPDSDFQTWRKRWQGRLKEEPIGASGSLELIEKSNPIYIPRNHRIQQAIDAEIDHLDSAKTMQLMEVLRHPYHEDERRDDYRLPPRPEEEVHQTFCGT